MRLVKTEMELVEISLWTEIFGMKAMQFKSFFYNLIFHLLENKSILRVNPKQAGLFRIWFNSDCPSSYLVFYTFII